MSQRTPGGRLQFSEFIGREIQAINGGLTRHGIDRRVIAIAPFFPKEEPHSCQYFVAGLVLTTVVPWAHKASPRSVHVLFSWFYESQPGIYAIFFEEEGLTTVTFDSRS